MKKPYTEELLDIALKTHPKTDPSRFVQALLVDCDLCYNSKKKEKNR